MDIVYPYKATHDHLELKYSIASISKFCTGVDNIYIVGDNPEIEGVIHIQAYDSYDSVFGKSRNIMEKIYYACMFPYVSDDFMMMNDDFFFMKSLNITNYPTYTGEFQTILDRKNDDPYKQNMIRTKDKFKDFISFEVHKPIIYNKAKFMQAMQSHIWKLPILTRSLYGNYWKLPDNPCIDYKVRTGDTVHDPDVISFAEGAMTEEMRYVLDGILSLV